MRAQFHRLFVEFTDLFEALGLSVIRHRSNLAILACVTLFSVTHVFILTCAFLFDAFAVLGILSIFALLANLLVFLVWTINKNFCTTAFWNLPSAFIFFWPKLKPWIALLALEALIGSAKECVTTAEFVNTSELIGWISHLSVSAWKAFGQFKTVLFSTLAVCNDWDNTSGSSLVWFGTILTLDALIARIWSSLNMSFLTDWWFDSTCRSFSNCNSFSFFIPERIDVTFLDLITH